jgi:L-alanine-DL-glutamate epimerase-like enolase superfamily enzyme
MKITEIKCWALSEELGSEWRVSGQTWSRINTVIVRIKTDEGHVGVGETNLRTAPRAGLAIIRDHLARHVLGADPRDIEGIWWNMFTRGRPRGHTRGFYLKAMSGIDMALWDMNARMQNEPLWRALKGVGKPKVPVYASAIRVFDTVEEAVEKGEEFVDSGHRVVKVMVAGRELSYDLAVFKALRKRFGDDIGLCADANSSFETTAAVRFATKAEEYDLLFFEEPVSPDNLRGYRRIRQASPMGLAAGQSEFTPFAAQPILAEGLIDFFQPNAGRVGGPTGVRYMQHAALPHGILFSAHVGASSVVNGLAALHLAAAAPERTYAEYWEDESPLINIAKASYPKVVDGHVELGEEPGLGLTLDEAMLDKMAVEMVIIDHNTRSIAQ